MKINLETNFLKISLAILLQNENKFLIAKFFSRLCNGRNFPLIIEETSHVATFELLQNIFSRAWKTFKKGNCNFHLPLDNIL